MNEQGSRRPQRPGDGVPTSVCTRWCRCPNDQQHNLDAPLRAGRHGLRVHLRLARRRGLPARTGPQYALTCSGWRCRPETTARSWLRCYRCWSQDLEVQVHYEGIHKIDPVTRRARGGGRRAPGGGRPVPGLHARPAPPRLRDGRGEPVEDRWERMITGTPWVASCTVTVNADDVETLLGPGGGRRALLRGLRRPRRTRVLHACPLP